MRVYYEEKGIKIYHGDCREVLPSLSAVDLVLTDPPYGLGAKLNGGSWGNVSKWDRLQPDVILSLDDFRCPLIIWGGNYYFLSPARCWLSWFKPGAPPSMAQFELAWTNLDQNSRQISHSIAATNAERVGHPTQKPLRVMRWCIGRSNVPEGATILDPFMGSGTTLRAAKDLGRQAIGIEIEERYCEIAAKRLSQEVLDFEGVA